MNNIGFTNLEQEQAAVNNAKR